MTFEGYIKKTEDVKCFLESKGFTRDSGEPFTYTGYSGKNKKVLVIDDSYTFQDVNMLIEDCEASKAYDIAHELREWIKAEQPTQ